MACRRSSSSCAARLHPGVHLRLEEAIGAAPVGLGAVQRQVGVLQQLVGVGAVARRACAMPMLASDDQ